MTLAHWDARWKLAAILISCAVIASLQTLYTTAAAGAIALIAAGIAGVSMTKLASRLGLIALSLVPFLVVLPFQYDSARGLHWTDAGAVLALTITLRALAIGTLAYLLVAGAGTDRTLVAAQSLGVPGTLVQVARLTHHYSTSLFDELRRLRIAWRVRAFQPRTSMHTYRTYARGLGAVLVRSGERGERVSAAMRARGYDGTLRSAVPFRTTLADVCGSTALVLAMLGLALGERLA